MNDASPVLYGFAFGAGAVLLSLVISRLLAKLAPPVGAAQSPGFPLPDAVLEENFRNRRRCLERVQKGLNPEPPSWARPPEVTAESLPPPPPGVVVRFDDVVRARRGSGQPPG